MSIQPETSYAPTRGLSASAPAALPRNSAWTPPPKKNNQPTMPNPLDAPQRRPPKERGPRPLTISFPMFWRTSAADLDPDFSPNPDSTVPEARSANPTRTSRNRTHQRTPSQRRRSVNEVNEAHLSSNEVGLDAMGADMDEVDGVRSTGDVPQQDRPASQGKKIRRMSKHDRAKMMDLQAEGAQVVIVAASRQVRVLDATRPELSQLSHDFPDHTSKCAGAAEYINYMYIIKAMAIPLMSQVILQSPTTVKL
ncbi:hypothetical protein FRC00_001209 [Tulasnella sp. 408]|nr:hypothetical protein FRC00_001209 [Tulasnella sp. 408]